MRSLPVHGRGSSRDPPNRFTELQVERDAWQDPDDPGPATRLFRDATRSVVTYNDSPDVGFDASVNPYRGCEHGCAYCMDGSTPILMGDGSLRPLAGLHAGDEIYGTVRRGHDRRYARTRILAHWTTEKEAYRIVLGDGTELVASADHRFLTLRGWKYVRGAQQGAARRPHLGLNDRLLGVGRTVPGAAPTDRSEPYRRGYVCGMVRGDARLAARTHDRRPGGGHRQHPFRLAVADESALARARHYLQSYGIATRRFMLQAGRGRKGEMHAIRSHRPEDRPEILRLIEWPASPPKEWTRGFLAGIFDAEGSFSEGALRISNANPVLAAVVRRSFAELGLQTVLEAPRRNGRGEGKPRQVVRLDGGLAAHLRFFHSAVPATRRKLDIRGRALDSDADLSVRCIEPAGRRTLFDITTGTGDFIADGVVSHNCYARPNHEYLGLSAGLDFESKIFVKEEAPELLRRELAAERWRPQVVVMSGVTDPYQPVERRMRVTRGCLEVLAEARNPVSVITKSHLVTRDVDLLARLAEVDAARVFLSVTTLRNEIHRVMEPRAAVPARRLDALRTLSRAGIPVGVMVGPVVPGLTEHELPDILEAAAEAGADRAGYIVLRLPFGVKGLFMEWLEQHFPERVNKVVHRLESLRGGRLNDPRFGSRMKGEGEHAAQIRQLFEITVRRLGLNREDTTLSTASFRRPPVDGEQLSLL